MDLQAAEKLNARSWNPAKIGAFVCFLAASALLIASLASHPAKLRLGAQSPLVALASVG